MATTIERVEAEQIFNRPKDLAPNARKLIVQARNRSFDMGNWRGWNVRAHDAQLHDRLSKFMPPLPWAEKPDANDLYHIERFGVQYYFRDVRGDVGQNEGGYNMFKFFHGDAKDTFEIEGNLGAPIFLKIDAKAVDGKVVIKGEQDGKKFSAEETEVGEVKIRDREGKEATARRLHAIHHHLEIDVPEKGDQALIATLLMLHQEVKHPHLHT